MKLRACKRFLASAVLGTLLRSLVALLKEDTLFPRLGGPHSTSASFIYNSDLAASNTHTERPQDGLSSSLPEYSNANNFTVGSDGKHTNTKSQKPLFVLHIGIHKTGTTFLQTTIGNMYVRKPSAWKRDNFAYLGTYSMIPKQHSTPSYGQRHKENVLFEGINDLRDYVYDPSIDRNASSWEISQSFVASINELAKMKTNVLFVYEPMSLYRPEQIQRLKELIEPHWEIQVIVSYRRLYEWLPSFYNQMAMSLSTLQSWPTYDQKDDASYPLSLEIDEREFETYRNGPNHFVSTVVRRFYAHCLKTGKHPTELAMDNYRRYMTPHVTLLPSSSKDLPLSSVTEVDPLLEYFFCSDLFLVKTTHVCQDLRKGIFNEVFFPPDSIVFNRAKPLDYDLLTVAAYRQGLIIRTNMTRFNIIEKIVEYHGQEMNRKTSDLPFTCMSPESLEQLEHFSFVVEQRLFPSKNDHDRKASRQEFHEAFLARRLSFCHVDTDVALSAPMWRSFFINL